MFDTQKTRRKAGFLREVHWTSSAPDYGSLAARGWAGHAVTFQRPRRSLTNASTTEGSASVLVSPAGHFENQFGNPAALNCYSLRNISEQGAKVVYGYVDKSSSLAKELDYWLQQSDDATVPMVLRLKYPFDSAVDFQVWIHQFVQAGWVVQ